MKTPEVRIYFSWLLYDTVSRQLDKLHKGTGKLVSQETARQFAENYRQEWAKYEASILPALVGALGVEFYQSVIDVPCAPWLRSISVPLTMGFRYYPNQFVDALTHELCHVLLTDNTTYSTNSSATEVDLRDRWVDLFGEQDDFIALVHIPVHALCKHIYLDVLQEPNRLKRDMEDVKDNPPYKAAWDYVNAHDYHEIIEWLEADYKVIEKELV